MGLFDDVERMRRSQNNYGDPAPAAPRTSTSVGTQGQRGRSQPLQYDPVTGQMRDPGGVFQGGTSSRRAGGAQNGMMGSPLLGTSAALINYGNQSPQNQAYLRQMGLVPTVNGFSAFSSNSGSAPVQLTPGMNSSDQAGRTFANGMIQSVPGPNGTTQYLDSTGMGVQPSSTWKRDSAGRLFDSASMPGMQGEAAFPGMGGGGGSGGGSGGGGGAFPVDDREQSDFELELQNSISGLLNQPRPYQRNVYGSRVEGSLPPGDKNYKGGNGYPNSGATNLGTEEALLRSNAANSIAAGTRQNQEAVRMDAARRGATNSQGGDAGVRDSLNRETARGASNQNTAMSGISKMISDIERSNLMGGLGAGNSLLNTQLTDARSLQQLLAQIYAIDKQSGQGNLNMLLGLAG